MRGMLNGAWYELEVSEEATFYMGELLYGIKDDPERGTFEAEDFEEFEP